MSAPAAPTRLRALFVSDLHLGYKGADIAALNALLSAHVIEHLYLVGDILDGWKLEKRWHWTQAYCDLIDRLMLLRRQGMPITLITGNHDDKLRDLIPVLLRPLIHRRYGIRIEESCVHRTATGARFLVLHGDQFDGRLFRNGSKVADRLWGWLTERGLARPVGTGRRWSLGRAIVREGGTLAERYAEAALKRATQEGADGIVFGHSHVPMLEDRKGRMLANCGAWTRPVNGHHTAIAETPDGRLRQLTWPASPAPALALAPTVTRPRDPDSLRLIRHIHALWRPGEPFPRPVPPLPKLDEAMPAMPGATPAVM